MPQSPVDVITYGEAMTLFVANAPGPLAQAEQFTKRIAGADLNVAIGLARLGFRVGYVSRVGADSFGRHVLDTLAQEGIDASCVTIDQRHRTGSQLKARAEGGADPDVEYFRKGSAASHLSLDDYAADYVLGARHLHLTGVAPAISATSCELAFHLAREMRAAGRSISFDPNLRPTLWPSAEVMARTLNELASHADWVLPGLAEGRALTGLDTPAEIARFYLANGARAGVVIKLGEAGAYYLTARGEEGTVAGERVARVVDTVGAGDGFAVGVVSALLEGRPIGAAVARGNRIGALAIQVIGDSEGLPTREQLERLEGAAARGPQAATEAPLAR
ncbi:sugar kinase [Burkholderia glumae]|uniref:sugar kinase n=1 Tax=Burkholderia glumae TaxID=337 RepID=UPI000F5DB197|nr:sugar kinase [Burkholderia glumae]RQZ73545.1 sugar kinase [Burkholderia glumae]